MTSLDPEREVTDKVAVAEVVAVMVEMTETASEVVEEDPAEVAVAASSVEKLVTSPENAQLLVVPMPVEVVAVVASSVENLVTLLENAPLTEATVAVAEDSEEVEEEIVVDSEEVVEVIVADEVDSVEVEVSVEVVEEIVVDEADAEEASLTRDPFNNFQAKRLSLTNNRATVLTLETFFRVCDLQ